MKFLAESDLDVPAEVSTPELGPRRVRQLIRTSHPIAKPTTAEVLEALAKTRARTLALVEPVGAEDLERVHSKLMSPLVWDLGHIAAFEDLWLIHRHGRRPLLRGDLVDVYDAFETPRSDRGSLPFLRSAQAREYLDEVRAQTVEVLEQGGVGDGVIAELVIRHEQQHAETMLQALALARLPSYRLPSSRGSHGPGRQAGSRLSGLELIEVPPGPCLLGARSDGFAYDNERPRHRADVRGYLIGRSPITNATYLTFIEGGGYGRREWWSDEGWTWKEQHDITRPGGWAQGLDGEWCVDGLQRLDPDRPVVHVSWFEADAFVRAHGARLPSEAEWEKAATWDQERGAASIQPWGNRRLRPGIEANVDQVASGPLPVSEHPDGVSPCGCEGMIGDTWEWTASSFTGYPGFRARPYREYSEVFFGSDYKVLRGGSWATGARVITAAYRNWDLPQRRQIFSGIRIARDL
jgi:iron(II)-dependent oxidoreductase